jgi:catalytic LigB subunit of aromatic ring-opening dioxygenase
MANLVAVLATTHHPFFYRASTAPPESRPDFADEWVRKVEAYRETLTRAKPDVLVMVGSDHFHQLFYDNMPQFLIGKAPYYDGNYYNEEREFGLPRMRLKGHEELSAYLLRAGLDAGFDFAFSNELRVDHSITCPIITTRPQTCRLCRSTRTSSRRHCRGRGASSSSAARCASWSKPGRARSVWPSSARGISPLSWAGRASLAHMAPIQSSTARPSSGSPAAISRRRCER